MDQTDSRPLNSDHDLFFMQIWLWEVLWNLFSVQPLSWSSPVVQLLYKIHFSSCHSLIGKWFVIVAYDKKTTLQNDDFFFFFWSAHKASTIKFFHLSNLFQMPNDCRMANAGFFSNFLCSCKRVSFDDALNWWFSASDGWPLCAHL